MTGKVVAGLNAGSFYLLTIDTGTDFEEVPVEPRSMADIIEAEGLEDPQDLSGRQVSYDEETGLKFTEDAQAS